MDATQRYQQARLITLLGAAKNTFLALGKIIFGITGHSHALLADGFHSLSDLLIDSLVLIASRYGSRDADGDHPYGHGRIETAATLLLGLVMSIAGLAIITDASWELLGMRETTKPDLYVLLVALVSILLNELLYHYTHWTGKRLQSQLLQANAWHHRSDSISSLVVLIGVGGAWLGLPLLDAIAAIIVGAMIVKMAWRFSWDSVRELVDTGLDPVRLQAITQQIEAVAGVRALHQLRTRSIATKIFLDVHILVDPTISVSEGHFIGQQVHFALTQKIAEVSDVTVHVDPEDDEVVAPSRGLPTRDLLLQELSFRWQDLIPPAVLKMAVLHYLSGKITIELKLPLSLLLTVTAAELTTKLQDRSADLPALAAITLLFY